MEGKILTLHPQGMNGVNLERSKYDQMRAAILEALREKNPLTFKELNQAVGSKLAGKFNGSIGWYCTTVKLDLEARGEIVCTRKRGSQQSIQLAAR